MSVDETLCRDFRAAIAALNHANQVAHDMGFLTFNLRPLTIKIQNLLTAIEARDLEATSDALRAIDKRYINQWLRDQKSQKRAVGGRKGGSASTPAKRAAAQANGKRGGRPKRPKT